MLKETDQGSFPIGVGLQWEKVTELALMGIDCLETPSSIDPKAKFPVGTLQDKVACWAPMSSVWNSLIHSTALNSLPISFFFFLAIWCRNLAFGSHLGHLLSLGQTSDPSRMAPKMGHLYLSLLLGFSFPFLSAHGPSLQAPLPLPWSLPSP